VVKMRIQIVKVHIPIGENEHHSAISQYMDSTGTVWQKPVIISWLRNTANSAFVQDRYGDTVNCEIVDSQYGNPYLKTKPDGIIADNLLSQPRF